MNAALASLFATPEPPKLMPMNPTQCAVLATLRALGGKAFFTELVTETGFSLNQVQCAVRALKQQDLLTAREVPKGRGRSFEYRLPTYTEPAPQTLKSRILLDLSEHGPSDAKCMAERLDVPEKTMRTTLSYIHRSHTTPGFTRDKVGHSFIYSLIGD